MSDDRTLVITRVLDAPRDMVFAAWIDQDQAALWWGPKGFTSVSCTMDVRVGGVWQRAMRSPDGTEHRARGVYTEISRPERLAFTYAWEDETGRPKHQTLVTLTFADLGNGRTELTLHQARFEDVAARDDHASGWSSCLDRFADHLAARVP